jgi:hypothetical protein
LKHQKIDRPSDSRLPAFDESSRILASPREPSSTDLGPRTVDLGPRTTDPRATSMATVAPLIDGRAQREHGQHAWCSWPTRDGLCVPAFLHREFVGKLAATKTELELRAWYRSTVAGMDGIAVGEDSVKFWRNTFAQWVGTVTSAPLPMKTDKGSRVYAAAERVIAKQLEHQRAVGDGSER